MIVKKTVMKIYIWNQPGLYSSRHLLNMISWWGHKATLMEKLKIRLYGPGPSVFTKSKENYQSSPGNYTRRHMRLYIKTPWWRHGMDTLSALLTLCEGHPCVTARFSPQRPVVCSFDLLLAETRCGTRSRCAANLSTMGLLPDTQNCGLRMRRECRERFTHHPPQRNRLVSDPDMHHGTCVTHVPWCMSGSLARGGGENVPSMPGACEIRNFTYLTRGPWCLCDVILLTCTA